MAKEIILLYTSILIEYFRKSDKSKSLLYKLSEQQAYKFAVSAISKYEIYVGSNKQQEDFWDRFFASITVLPFDDITAGIAADLDKELKLKRKQIAIPDLFIASTARQSGIKIATHNKKHFERIKGLELFNLSVI